jgi:hypothetical protein
VSAGRDVSAEEWDFTSLAAEETGPAWFYESLRELVLRLKGATADAYRAKVDSLRVRELVRGKNGKEERVVLLERHEPLPTVIPVGFEPEWPDTPYLAIPQGQRIERLRDLLPEFFPDSTEYLLEDLLPFRVPVEVIETLAAQLRTGEHPVLASEHLHSWMDYLLGQHALESDYRLDTIYRRYAAVIIIDPTIGFAAFKRRTEALWQMLAGEEQAKAPGRPPGSLPARSRANLQQLGAYRLVKVFGLSIEDAIARIIERLREHAYYTDPRNFQRAVEECEKELAKLLQPPESLAE